MFPQSFGSARRAFQLIIVGALICFIDIWFGKTVNGVGYRFDFINDAAGTLLIAAGVWRLSAVYVSDGYRRLMAFVRLVATLAVLAAINGHWIRPVGTAAGVFWRLAGTLESLGPPAFFLAMSLLWRSLAPPGLARHWRWAAIGSAIVQVSLIAWGLAEDWHSLFLPAHASGPALITLDGGSTLLATLLAMAPLALGGITFWRGYRALGRQPAAAIIPPLIEVAPVSGQRRWPLVGAIILLPRLLRRGAIR